MTTTKTVSDISYIHSHTNFLLIYRRLAAAKLLTSKLATTHQTTITLASTHPICLKCMTRPAPSTHHNVTPLYATHSHVVEVCSWKCGESGSVAHMHQNAPKLLQNRNIFLEEHASRPSYKKVTYTTATFQWLCGLHLLP